MSVKIKNAVGNGECQMCFQKFQKFPLFPPRKIGQIKVLKKISQRAVQLNDATSISVETLAFLSLL